ncbi:unnamed protein product [Phaedon cochleariae]|uniref:Acyl-CoA-binding domain-containing protein 6 n=1 Tax=Phaedon cochleariae TaxID=80249 RepID=A0A9N9SIU0_PHACE|nr:unnamed protein product [Phaedon cochleariae]
MASSVDNFSDLQELGIDINEPYDKQTQEFFQAADHLQKLLPTVDNQTLLTLYGYYKQGTEGPCMTPKPSWYDMRAKSKWEAWKKLENMPQGDAKILYTETIKKIDPTFNKSSNENSIHQQGVRVSAMKTEEISTCDFTIVDHIKKGNFKEVQNYLKMNSASINNLDSEGLALVHWATDCGDLNILKMLINSGADINSVDEDGQTALHYAASCGHADLVQFLVENGAEFKSLDNEGNSALDVAADDGIRHLLLK